MDIITYALCKKQIGEALQGAGALKGQKGDPGKSAFEIAQKNGFSGTEQDWIESLVGQPGKDGLTPSIGANGNWFLGDKDTNIPARATQDYEDLQNKPSINGTPLSGDVEIDIPAKTSDLENDSKFITEDDLPKNISELIDDVGYLTSKDIEDFLTKDEVENLIPTKVSELDNDEGFLKEHQKIKTINGESLIGEGNLEIDSCRVHDILVNDESIVDEDKIARINIEDPVMGRDFTTNVSVGYLESGTFISQNDKVADVLYRILYKKPLDRYDVTLHFGASDEIPTSVESITSWHTVLENQDPDTLLANGAVHLIKTGNPETEDGQYATLACSKSVRLIKLQKWTAQGAEMIPLNYGSVDTEDYFIYYITNPTYDEDLGGTIYIFTFQEVL